MVNSPPNKDWSEKIQEIATDWLFSDLDLAKIPTNIILPLENRDLYDRSSFTSRIDRLENYKSISIGFYQNIPVGVLNSKFGSPAVAMVVHILSSIGISNSIDLSFSAIANNQQP